VTVEAIHLGEEGVRRQLVAGQWDTTGELLAAKAAIEDVAARVPYFDGWT